MVTYSRNVLWLPISRAREAALPFQVLRFQADAGEGKNLVVLAQRGMAVNDDMGMEPAVLSQRHIFADDTIRPDDATGANPRLRMNHGRGSNHTLPVKKHKCHFRLADRFRR